MRSAASAGGSKAGRVGGGGINRDIQRLFTQKISTFPGVELDSAANAIIANRTMPVWAICKIAFKAMMEIVRMEVGHTATSTRTHAARLLARRLLLE